MNLPMSWAEWADHDGVALAARVAKGEVSLSNPHARSGFPRGRVGGLPARKDRPPPRGRAAKKATRLLPVGQAAAWRACASRHTFSGVAGMSTWRTPCPLSASTSALITAAGAPTEPASPQPFTPIALFLQGTSSGREVEGRHVVGARHGVVHERAGQQLAALVVDRTLQQRLADALDDAAMHLALDQHRVQHHAEIVDDVVVDHAARCRCRDRPRPRRCGSRWGRSRR